MSDDMVFLFHADLIQGIERISIARIRKPR